MNKPQVDVLGVYRLPVTNALFREQFDILYGYPMSERQRLKAERQCREQLSSVVLIEVLVSNPDDRFDVGQFSQSQDGVPKENWQVAWNEALLSLDGEALASEGGSALPDSSDMRIAFFLHFWQANNPLLTSYGEVQCPNAEEMPARLSQLVPYEPVD